LDLLEEAFQLVAATCEPAGSAADEPGSVDTLQLVQILQENGEAMTELELAESLVELLGRDDFENVLPPRLTASAFAAVVLGMSTGAESVA
jgi:hypothetical protein